MKHGTKMVIGDTSLTYDYRSDPVPWVTYRKAHRQSRRVLRQENRSFKAIQEGERRRKAKERLRAFCLIRIEKIPPFFGLGK